MLEARWPLERASRLRRYLRKDYSQVVEFPVEIVGRDGTVRRYSFGDSVRLYHRRIHSAPMRYDDGDLVDAEVRHCRQRIDQLRRSYLEHYGWGVLRGGQLGGLFGGPLAAELAAFLRRAFVSERDGPTGLRLTLIESSVGDTFYLRCIETDRVWLLYAWRLDADAPSGAREAWRAAVTRLAAAPRGDTAERLLFAAEGPDVALALAGTGAWHGPGGDGAADAEPLDPPDPLHTGLRALYDGHSADALSVLEAGLDVAPARLGLAQAAALVALLEGQEERGEFAARFGRLHRPGDPVLAYLLSVALCRTGRRAEAHEVVRAGLRAAPNNPLLTVMAAVLALRAGRLVAAWRGARRVTRLQREPPYAGRAARTLELWLRRWAAATGGGALAVGVGAGLHTVGDATLGLAVGAAGLASGVYASVWLARRAVAVVRGVRVRGVPRLVSLELLPREGELDVDH